jgi:hypothetical protein
VFTAGCPYWLHRRSTPAAGRAGGLAGGPEVMRRGGKNDEGKANHVVKMGEGLNALPLSRASFAQPCQLLLHLHSPACRLLGQASKRWPHRASSCVTRLAAESVCTHQRSVSLREATGCSS